VRGVVSIGRRVLIAAFAAAILLAAAWSAIRPSNDRDWIAEQAFLPRAEFDGDFATITNVRAFDHCPSGGVPVKKWETRSVDLSEIESVWLALSLFEQNWRGPAHSFISFGFADSTFLAVSVEARKEKGEIYSPGRGMAKRFELVYVVADEEDVLKLRAVCRNDRVFLYPLKVDPEKGRELLVEILKSANELADNPKFYNTVWNNCTTVIIDRANAVASKRIPGGLHSFLPGYSDKVLHSLGLIEDGGSLDEIRERYYVNETARRYADHPRFSVMVRR